MKSYTTERFRRCLRRLPESVRRQARDAYQRFQKDPQHPGLHFKRVHATKSVYSVRMSLDYRAVGARDGDDMIWLWIGSHADYEKLLAQL